MSNKPTSKRGEHYTILDDNSIQVSLDGVGVPSAAYSADWFAVEGGRDSVRLCFGQRFGGRLMSRVDIRMPQQQFRSLVETNRGFFETLARVPIADPSEWQVDVPVGPDGKNLLEDASVAAMAYSGPQAEINFFQVPSVDIWLAQSGNRDRQYRGPRPVVTIVLLTSQLSWVMREALSLTDMRET